MKVENIGPDNSLIDLSRSELGILNNVLNEVCHGVKIPGFSIRIGATKDEAKQLLRQINELIGTMDDLSPDRERSKVIVHEQSDEQNSVRRKRIK